MFSRTLLRVTFDMSWPSISTLPLRGKYGPISKLLIVVCRRRFRPRVLVCAWFYGKMTRRVVRLLRPCYAKLMSW